MTLRSLALLVSVTAITAAAAPPAAAQQTLTNTIVYNVPARQYCWLESPPLPDAVAQSLRNGGPGWRCPDANLWRPERNAFRAGSIVQLVIVNGRFRSTYEPTVNAVEIHTLDPVIRGIDDAEKLEPAKVAQPAETHGLPNPSLLSTDKTESSKIAADPDALAEDARKLLEELRKLHAAAMQALLRARPVLAGILGPAPLPSGIGPGMRLRRLEAFARSLDTQASAAAIAIPAANPVYTDLVVFDRLVEQTDLLVVNVNQLNERMKALDDDLKAVVIGRDAMNAYLTAANDATGRVGRARAAIPGADASISQMSVQPSTQREQMIKNRQEAMTRLRSALDGLDPYLPPNGARYVEVHNGYDETGHDLDDILPLTASVNQSMPNIFDSVNLLYTVSQSPVPFEVLIGQWTTNERVEFTVVEKSGFKAYGFDAGIDPSRAKKDGDGDGDGGSGVKVDAALLADDAPKKPAGTNVQKAKVEKPEKPEKPQKPEEAEQPVTPAQTPGPAPKTLISHKAFTVHQFARASVTSGFVFSSLRSNEFGIEQVRAVDDNGKPRATDDGAPIFDRVAVRGTSTRPQSHYYAGLLYYFKERDLFPGANRNSYGMLIGYGLTEQLNFFLGLSAEFKWGINATVGWHLGREKFPAPGIVTREDATADRPYTHLADSVTEVPTVTRTAPKGIFGSVGFDLRVFAKVFGGATGTVKP